MIIINKTIDDICKIDDAIPKKDSLRDIRGTIAEFIAATTKDEYNYQDLVSVALKLCHAEIPSPFSSMYPNCYGLNLGNDFFTIRIPNKFGFGVRVFLVKNKIKYELSIVFYNPKAFVEQSDYYNELINDGWKVKSK